MFKSPGLSILKHFVLKIQVGMLDVQEYWRPGQLFWRFHQLFDCWKHSLLGKFKLSLSYNSMFLTQIDFSKLFYRRCAVWLTKSPNENNNNKKTDGEKFHFSSTQPLYFFMVACRNTKILGWAISQLFVLAEGRK